MTKDWRSVSSYRFCQPGRYQQELQPSCRCGQCATWVCSQLPSSEQGLIDHTLRRKKFVSVVTTSATVTSMNAADSPNTHLGIA